MKFMSMSWIFAIMYIIPILGPLDTGHRITLSSFSQEQGVRHLKEITRLKMLKSLHSYCNLRI